MAGNSIGKLFTVTSFGDSHGPAIGCVVDGCPPGLELSEADMQVDLDRRKPGTSRFTTQRREADEVRILSGLFEGRTTGTPIGLLIENTDQRSKDYSKIADRFRPMHADYTYQAKYGIRNWQGGGRSSARETIGRVAAAAIAKTMNFAVCASFGGSVELAYAVDTALHGLLYMLGGILVQPLALVPGMFTVICIGAMIVMPGMTLALHDLTLLLPLVAAVPLTLGWFDDWVPASFNPHDRAR